MKVSPKGALSVYGLGRFPVSLYKEQWARLLDAALLHESNVARNDPDPVVGHRLIAYDAGLPKSLIRFST